MPEIVTLAGPISLTSLFLLPMSSITKNTPIKFLLCKHRHPEQISIYPLHSYHAIPSTAMTCLRSSLTSALSARERHSLLFRQSGVTWKTRRCQVRPCHPVTYQLGNLDVSRIPPPQWPYKRKQFKSETCYWDFLSRASQGGRQFCAGSTK